MNLKTSVSCYNGYHCKYPHSFAPEVWFCSSPALDLNSSLFSLEGEYEKGVA